MPESRATLNGAQFTGFVEVRELPVQGMVTLRGTLNDPKMITAIKKATGADMPGPRQVQMTDGASVGWMSPDELLLMVPHGDVRKTLVALDEELGGSHALALDVSDARAVFDVKGPKTREVVAKLAPVDLDPSMFKIGELRRSRAAQVPVAFWLTDEETVRLVCFRSVAQYVFDLLKSAATEGREVDYFVVS